MIVIVLAYVLGAVPGGYVITRYFWRLHATWLEAVRLPPRAHSVVATYGPAVYSTLADVAKGVLTVWLVPLLAEALLETRWAWLIYPLISPGIVQVAALSTAVVSHVLSVYICGWGGKGVAVALGGFLVLAPHATVYALAACAAAGVLSRKLWISTVTAAWALPLCIRYTDQAALLLQCAAFVLALSTTAIHLSELRSSE